MKVVRKLIDCGMRRLDILDVSMVAQRVEDRGRADKARVVLDHNAAGDNAGFSLKNAMHPFQVKLQLPGAGFVFFSVPEC